MRYPALVLTILVVAAACTGSQQADTPATTVAATEAPATTVAPATTEAPVTTAAPAATTTAPPTTAAPSTTVPSIFYTIGTPSIDPPAPIDGSAGANGSGCSPGAGALPAGVWFGFVDTKGASSVEFDLACFFFGDAADTAATADGFADVVEDGYYVRNQNHAIRTVPVANGATVYVLPGGDTTFSTLDFSVWAPGPGDFGHWLVVNDGAVTEIMEQYAP